MLNQIKQGLQYLIIAVRIASFTGVIELPDNSEYVIDAIEIVVEALPDDSRRRRKDKQKE